MFLTVKTSVATECVESDVFNYRDQCSNRVCWVGCFCFSYYVWIDWIFFALCFVIRLVIVSALVFVISVACVSFIRSAAWCCRCPWIYPQDVYWAESWSWQDYLLSLHMCNRYFQFVSTNNLRYQFLVFAINNLCMVFLVVPLIRYIYLFGNYQKSGMKYVDYLDWSMLVTANSMIKTLKA